MPDDTTFDVEKTTGAKAIEVTDSRQGGDHLLFGPDGVTRGRLDEGDIRVVDIRSHPHFGRKFILRGDTRDILSHRGENLADRMDWETAHCGYENRLKEWICDVDGLHNVVEVLTKYRYTIAVDSAYEDVVTTPT